MSRLLFHATLPCSIDAVLSKLLRRAAAMGRRSWDRTGGYGTMDKREFLKITGMVAGGAMLGQYAKAEELPAHQTNWAGNLHYHADHLYAPANTAELQELVRKLPKIRALGSRHCFNTIADTPASQISLLHFDSMELDSAAHTVTVGAGVRYGILAPWLDQKGYAVHNLASLPHITVAGAVATATHGSGVRNG